jgi:hypothetical protein
VGRCGLVNGMLADGTLEAFRLQGEFCAKMGSPFYGDLLARAADDIERAGPVARVLDGWTGNPIPDALVLRLMGAVHRLVLDGGAPELARYYPSAGGTPQWPAAWEAFARIVDTHADELRPALARHVQTNEVRRSMALLGGFLTVARTQSLPLRLLEIGCSAGLNLCWDRYRYEVVPIDAAEASVAARPLWGDADSPVTIRTGWDGPLDVFGARATVAERGGCDIAPIDVTDSAHVRTLESFVWADQLERLRQLRAAVAVARRAPPAIARRRAADWLAEQLAAPRAGIATVVFHSIMWWYLSEEERELVTAHITAAGSRADANAPLAWLRFELRGVQDPEIRLTQWPGGAEVVLGRADPHGRYVHWYDAPDTAQR